MLFWCTNFWNKHMNKKLQAQNEEQMFKKKSQVLIYCSFKRLIYLTKASWVIYLKVLLKIFESQIRYGYTSIASKVKINAKNYSVFHWSSKLVLLLVFAIHLAFRLVVGNGIHLNVSVGLSAEDMIGDFIKLCNKNKFQWVLLLWMSWMSFFCQKNVSKARSLLYFP